MPFYFFVSEFIKQATLPISSEKLNTTGATVHIVANFL